MPTTPSRPQPEGDAGRRPLPNSYWVVPGSLLAGEYPIAEGPEATRQRLRQILRAGIDAFVDLTQLGERPEAASATASGLMSASLFMDGLPVFLCGPAAMLMRRRRAAAFSVADPTS